MATEQASTVTSGSGSLAKWASWIAALVGLWVLASPFVLSGPITSGTAMWSNIAAGIAIAILAGYGAYLIRASAEMAASATDEAAGWLAALAGSWIVASPFALAGMITAGPAKWSNVAAGAVALVLAGYTGYLHHAGE